MNEPSLLDQLNSQYGDHIVATEVEAIDPWIELTPAGLVDVCRYLKTDPRWQLDMLNCITAVDYLHTDPKKAAKVDWEPHLEVVYHLSSTRENKHTLVIKVKLPRWQEEAADSNGEPQLPEIPSVAAIWRTADWHEREVYDLSGVFFTGHPNLRRILCPEDWVGYPLRKDYELPLEYHGIRNR
jgi:NADH-quinone oxidoreductase subunit C